jgi:hypothetical protein
MTDHLNYIRCSPKGGKLIVQMSHGGESADFSSGMPLSEVVSRLRGLADRLEGKSSQSEVIAFLLGEGPLDGVWFGDPHPTEKGAFWWRKHLRGAAGVTAPSGTDRLMAMAEEIRELCQTGASDSDIIDWLEKASLALGVDVPGEGKN